MPDDIDMPDVHRDDRLLDALAARLPVEVDDPADPLHLLAALALDVDAPLPGGMADEVVEPTPLFAGRRRRRLLLVPRGAAALGVAGAVVFASGVATAVTGDPLAPLEPIRRVIATVAEQVTAAPSRRESVGRALDGADDALSRGDRRAAAELITDAQRQLGELGQPAEDLHAKLATLEQQLVQQAAATPSGLPVAAPPTTPPASTDATTGPAEPTAEPSEPTGVPTVDPPPTAPPSPDPSGDPTAPPPDDTGTPSPSESPSGTPSGTPSTSAAGEAPEQPQAAPPEQQAAPERAAPEQPAPEQAAPEQPEAVPEPDVVADLVPQVTAVVHEVLAEALPPDVLRTEVASTTE